MFDDNDIIDEYNLFVDFDDYDNLDFKMNSIEKRTNYNSSNSYHVIGLSYDYHVGIDRNIINDNLYLQLSECDFLGILKSVDHNDKNKYKYKGTILFNLDDNNKRCINKIKSIYDKCCNFVLDSEVRLGLKYFDKEYIKNGSIFRNPIKYMTNRCTGEIIENKKPYMMLKMPDYGINKTKFLYQDMNDIDSITGYPKLKPVEWNYIEKLRLKIIPLVKFESLNIQNGSVSLRCLLHSVIILNFHNPQTNFRQSITSNRLYKNNQNQAKNVTNKILILREEIDKENKELILNDRSGTQDIEYPLTTQSLSDFMMDGNLQTPRNTSSQIPNFMTIPKYN